VLSSIKVQNFALIDQADLQFSEGFTAITGETGSGKSILLGAIGLLLGQRAESKIFRNNDQKCIIEANFKIVPKDWASFFDESDLDLEDQIHIRREILPNGKSRSFINDTPVGVQTLKSAGERLVDIHSQHGQSLIGKRNFQLEVLDTAAVNETILLKYQEQFSQWQTCQQKLNQLEKQRDEWLAASDFIQFQLDEIQKIDWAKMDVPLLEQEIHELQHAEEILSAASHLQHVVLSDNGILSQLQALINQSKKAAAHSSALTALMERLLSCQIELKDIASEAEEIGQINQSNPAKLQALQEQLGEVYRLQQKHRVETVHELIQLQEQWILQLGQYQNVDSTIEQLQSELEVHKKQMLSTGELLHQRRMEAAQTLSAEILQKLSLLSMEHAQLDIQLQYQEATKDGISDVQFLFTANKGSMPQPIEMVASGGEISRFMLAIKAALSLKKQMPVLILDEIDQGVSGEVANKIGSLLQSVSHQMQIISITHLPQVASKANHHFKVLKDHSGDKTTTMVQALSPKDRIQEIAEMLSGKTPTPSAIANAKELLKV
jgi:DNA repair protein RecN (Recombination protein N)